MNFNGKIYKISNGTKISICDDDTTANELKLYIKSDSLYQKRLVFDQILRCITKRKNLDADTACFVSGGLVLGESEDQLRRTAESKLGTREEVDDEKQRKN